jgi:hypothetical protein
MATRSPADRSFARVLVALALAATFALAGAGCRNEPPPTPDPVVLPETTTENLFDLVRGSELIVAGEVVEVGPAPGRYEDPTAYQGVTYRVIETLKGGDPGDLVHVAHPILPFRPFVDETTRGLSADYVHPGAAFVLFLNRDDSARISFPTAGGAWISDAYVWDDRNGVLQYSESVVEEVHRAIRAYGDARTRKGDPFAGGRRR